MKKLIFFLYLFSSPFFLIYSQVNMNIIIRKPTPANISVWQTDPTIIQIIITNNSNQAYPNSFITFNIINENNVIVANTKNDDPSIPRINIPPGPGTFFFNGTQIFNTNAVNFDESIKTVAILTNSIPEGSYQFCARLLDQYGKELSVTGEICTNFFVMIPDPPTLLSPINDEIINTQYPNFIWTPVTNAAPGTFINYKLKICPIFQGQSPRTAIESNQILFEKNNINTTSYFYLPSDLSFNYFPNAIGYVWMVTAYNQFGQPATRNEGKSELGTFRVGQGTISSSIDIESVYPKNNDTIPWNPPHLIVKYTPYSDNIRTIKYTLTFKKDGNSQPQTFTRELNFPTGPQNSQALSTQEKASLLFVNVDSLKNIISWMRNLEEGSKYLWRVTVEFTRSTGEKVTASTNEFSFVVGLKKPEKISPKNDTSIQVNTPMKLAFKVPTPSQLNFNLIDVLQERGFHASGVSTSANGKFKFELSKTNTFDSLITSTTFQIPSSSSYSSGNNCDSLFNLISKDITTLSDTGTYYWRISYLKSSNESYFTTNTQAIKVTPVTKVSCFDMLVQIPEHLSYITTNKPKFSVSIKPQIRKSSITGGKIKIWKMDSRSQLVSEVKLTKPLLDTTFSGNDNSKLFAYTPDFNGYTRYDLNFINTDSTSISFTADTSKHYLWNFTLNYKNDSIRTDGIYCDSNFVTSNDGIFSYSNELASSDTSCAGDCTIPAPTNTTISSINYAKDSTIKIGQFDLKLTSVSGSASSLSGEGEIEVPYLRAPILVEFNGLKVNTDNQVFEGEAYAKISEGAGYSISEGNDFSGQVLNMANDKIKSLHEKLENHGLYVSAFTNANPVGLPIGFDKVVKGHRVVIAIIGMKFTPTQAVLNATAYVEFPKLGPGVGFGLGGKNICFHKKGISGSGQGTLYLAQDFGYRNEGTWSILFKAPTPSDRGTYINWDCHGFKEFVVSAEVEFPRSWLKPTSTNDTTKLAKAVFSTKAEKSGNGWQWIATANLEECEITNLPGFKINVQDMSFDFSSERNPETISFPKNYTGTTNNEWEGFFIRRATLTLPDKLKTFENENPSLLINNMIINGTGFTSYIESANIFQYPKGNFGGWGASIDSIKLDFVCNSLRYGLIKGRIGVPFLDTLLNYSGTLARATNTNKLIYHFLIVPSDTLNISFGGKIKLEPSSRIELYDTSSNFVAQAILNGSYNLEGKLGKLSSLGLSGITFEGLGISTESPYLLLQNWNFASPQHSISGFPITINNIELLYGTRSNMPAAGIKFTVGINLQPNANAISGSTTLSLWAKLLSNQGPQKFVFDGAELNAISINADLGAVKINGSVNIFDNHPTYGDGFRGAVDASFVDQFSASATAQFGTVNNYRYWYVDAKAILPVGVPIFSSGIGIYGFGGGAWYHMEKIGNTNISGQQTSSTDSSSTPGITNSGFTYRPNKNINFGFKATVVLGTYPSPESFNGDLSFEADFLSNGGIGRISVNGPAYMLCGITNRNKAKITANANIEYNFPTKTLDGNLQVNINATPLTGNGFMALHFSPNLWFIKVGEPDNRINLRVTDWLTGGGYFMTGMNLPAPSSLPTEVQNLYPNYASTPRSNLIQQGKGFAYGLNIDINTGKQEYLNFYGNARFIGGYDFCLTNLGEGTTCEGRSGSIGVNGWYAMGQIYAYANASIGLHIDTYFYEGDYEILSLSAGAILQGGTPNPTWIKGSIGGYYRIFNGKIKGYCNFEFKLGDECRPVIENPLSRIDLISDVNPLSGTTNVDVYTEPQVSTNFQLNTPLEIEEMPGQSQNSRLRIFRINLRPLSLINLNNNKSINGSNVISQDKYSAHFSFNDALSSNTRYKFTAIAYGEEFISGNWQPARKKDNSLVEQIVESIFTTGTAPDNIPQNIVQYTYPFNGNLHFLQGECKKGLVQLDKWPTNVFTTKEGYRQEYIARFIPNDNNSQFIDVSFSYNSNSKTISFDIPALQNNKEYYLQLIKKETRIGSSGFTPGIGSTNQFLTFKDKVLLEKNSSSVYFEQSNISSSRVKPGEKLLYMYYFKTSRYNTLQEKMASYNYNSTQSYIDGIHEYQKAKYIGTEDFDYYDFNPYKWYKDGYTFSIGPLVRFFAEERSSSWHNSFSNPFIYDQIQWIKSKNLWSGDIQFDNAKNNLLPTKLIEVEYQSSQPNIANAVQMGLSGNNSTSSTGSSGVNIQGLSGYSSNIGLQSSITQSAQPYLIIKYNHGLIIPNDFLGLKTKAVAILSNPILSTGLNSTEKNRLNLIINRNYQPMTRGNYPVKFGYNYRGCLGIDQPIPTFNKPFVY